MVLAPLPIGAPAAAAPGAEPLSVVVSIPPWADLVAQVGGDAVEVTTLLPAGASPHAFDPLPSQALRLARADLVVMNGGLDAWLARLLEATAPGTPLLTLIGAVEFEPLPDVHAAGTPPDAGSAAADPEAAGAAAADAARDGDIGVNPHIWLDPAIALAAVPVIASALSQLAPDRAAYFDANAEQLAASLQRLDAEVGAMLKPYAGMRIVPFHDAWPYFVRRYGLIIAATLEPFPGREPSARYVADTVATIRQAGVQVIFSERQLNDRTARVVAESAGVAVVTLDPLGGAPGPERYHDLLRENALKIVEALEMR